MECAACEEKTKRINILKGELKRKDEVLREKNMKLDALHYVWCSGSCEKGIHRFTDEELTDEQILFLFSYATRLAEKHANLLSKDTYNKDREKSRRMAMIYTLLAKDDLLREVVEERIEEILCWKVFTK